MALNKHRLPSRQPQQKHRISLICSFQKDRIPQKQPLSKDGGVGLLAGIYQQRTFWSRAGIRLKNARIRSSVASMSYGQAKMQARCQKLEKRSIWGAHCLFCAFGEARQEPHTTPRQARVGYKDRHECKFGAAGDLDFQAVRPGEGLLGARSDMFGLDHELRKLIPSCIWPPGGWCLQRGKVGVALFDLIWDTQKCRKQLGIKIFKL